MKSLKVLTAMLLSVTLIFSSCGSWNNTQKVRQSELVAELPLALESVQLPATQH